MTPETRMLVQYRLDRAHEALAEASLLLDSGHANTGVNRLYYACFYAVSALLLTKGLTATSHSGLSVRGCCHSAKGRSMIACLINGNRAIMQI